MATLCLKTGKLISDIDEVWQSLQICVTTKRGTRVMRRDFASDLPRLVDRPISPLTLVDYYAAIAGAARHEPRIRIVQMKLSPESDVEDGEAIFDVKGVYFPRGHLGDYSEAQDVTGRIVMP